MFYSFSSQALAIRTLATTEEHVRSVRPTGATPSLVMSASVHQASVEFTASTVSWTALFLAPLKSCDMLTFSPSIEIKEIAWLSKICFSLYIFLQSVICPYYPGFPAQIMTLSCEQMLNSWQDVNPCGNDEFSKTIVGFSEKGNAEFALFCWVRS